MPKPLRVTETCALNMDLVSKIDTSRIGNEVFEFYIYISGATFYQPLIIESKDLTFTAKHVFRQWSIEWDNQMTKENLTPAFGTAEEKW